MENEPKIEGEGLKESPPVPAPDEMEAIEPHPAAVDLVHDIKPVRDNGT
jgi:hypothetical protein